jgi:hypothetical protein
MFPKFNPNALPKSGVKVYPVILTVTVLITGEVPLTAHMGSATLLMLNPIAKGEPVPAGFP